MAHNVINVPIAPMWKNSQPRSRSQSPIPERSHNTRNKNRQKALQTGEGIETASTDTITKERTISSSSAEEQLGGTKDSTFQPQSPNRSTPKKQSQPSFLYGTGREAYRKSIQQRLLPALRAFNPDLILLSIGLDACKGDVGNARHYRNGRQVQGIDLTPEDYAWTTQKVRRVSILNLVKFCKSLHADPLPYSDYGSCRYLLSWTSSFCFRRWLWTTK